MVSERRHRCNYGTAMHIQSVGRKNNYAETGKYVYEDEEYIYRKNYRNNKKETKSNKKKYKKIVKNTNSVIEEHSIVKESERVKAVLKAANNHCECCGKEIKNLDYSNVYAIEARQVDKDSILNMVVLCLNCINKVSFRSDDEEVKNKLKKIAEKRLDNMDI